MLKRGWHFGDLGGRKGGATVFKERRIREGKGEGSKESKEEKKKEFSLRVFEPLSSFSLLSA